MATPQNRLGLPATRPAILALALLLVGATTLLADQAAESRAAFLDVYSVLMHPRCLNCHPAGDRPLQGDDSHVHTQNIKRGAEGMGVYAQQCDTCHQSANLPGANMPPGSPTWKLSGPGMPLVFQGKSPRQLAEQLKDPARNGHRTLRELVSHVTEDKLVLWGWSPGDGRTPPPLPHDRFAARFKEWVDKGAELPEK